MNDLLSMLALGAMVGAGLIAGVFFAFSNFVMRALLRVPPAHGHAAMQAINVTVLNPVFLGVFAGTAPDAGLEWSDYAARWTRWNHVRTLAAALATVAFGAGLLQR